MTTLIIFDIDGTLTETIEVDSICYAQAVSEYLNIHNLNTDWHKYKYSTDSGLLSEIFNSYLKRDPTVQEKKAIQARFVELLTFQFHTNNNCVPIAGASDIIFHIQKSN